MMGKQGWRRKLGDTERVARACIQAYAEVAIPQLSDNSFRDHSRLSKSTFAKLCLHLRDLDDFAIREHHGGRPLVPIEKQIQIALWILGNQESFRQVADRFDVSDPKFMVNYIKSLQLYLGQLQSLQLFLVQLQQNSFVGPTKREDIIVAEFGHKSGGFPGVVGAIDGCHILSVKAPVEDPVFYITRKG